MDIMYIKRKKLLKYILNNAGPTIDPCSAPDTADLNLQYLFSIVNFKHCFQSFKHKGI